MRTQFGTTPIVRRGHPCGHYFHRGTRIHCMHRDGAALRDGAASCVRCWLARSACCATGQRQREDRETGVAAVQSVQTGRGGADWTGRTARCDSAGSEKTERHSGRACNGRGVEAGRPQAQGSLVQNRRRHPVSPRHYMIQAHFGVLRRLRRIHAGRRCTKRHSLTAGMNPACLCPSLTADRLSAAQAGATCVAPACLSRI